jgi:hypothetical protein
MLSREFGIAHPSALPPNFFGDPTERRFPPQAGSGKMALLIDSRPLRFSSSLCVLAPVM